MNIEELKQLAEAATPGPWISHPKGYYGAVCRADDPYDLVAVTHGQSGNNALANESYIAAANPAAVLELIDYVEYLRGKNREHFDACTGCDEELNRVSKQRDELLAALKRIKANLMHQRLCGQSAGLLHAAIQAEGDAEEVIAKMEG